MVRLRSRRPSRAHEAELWAAGYEVVAGVDEVGRGCLAGPVVAAAVILPSDCKLRGVRDSKLLNLKQRQRAVSDIKRQAEAIGVGWASSAEVDRYGLTWAVQASGLRALGALAGVKAVLLDGNHNYLLDRYHARAIIKADGCCLSVAAASIVAKVARDKYMQSMHRLYPSYGFDTNVGYGTPQHLAALAAGLSPIHRRLFAPVSQVSLGL